jgi:hypothetical protein
MGFRFQRKTADISCFKYQATEKLFLIFTLYAISSEEKNKEFIRVRPVERELQKIVLGSISLNISVLQLFG